MGLGFPVCQNCRVIGELIEHYYMYNHHEWVCPICRNHNLTEYSGVDSTQFKEFEDNLTFLKFAIGKRMPKLYMLVGVPGAGKSTWIANQKFDSATTVIASTDNYIEEYAKSIGKTYSEVFRYYIPHAERAMKASVADAVKNGFDIVWDQTNTTLAGRSKKLKMIPDTYEKIAVVFSTPEAAELAIRLSSRPGKFIPGHVMDNMIASMQLPTLTEGFKEITQA